MLILLFVLAVVYTICTVLIHNLIKKKNLSSMSYGIFSVIQGACMSASVIILFILLLKGRTLV